MIKALTLVIIVLFGTGALALPEYRYPVFDFETKGSVVKTQKLVDFNPISCRQLDYQWRRYDVQLEHWTELLDATAGNSRADLLGEILDLIHTQQKFTLIPQLQDYIYEVSIRWKPKSLLSDIVVDPQALVSFKNDLFYEQSYGSHFPFLAHQDVGSIQLNTEDNTIDLTIKANLYDVCANRSIVAMIHTQCGANVNSCSRSELLYIDLKDLRKFITQSRNVINDISK